jgi:hypothetical protein
MTLFERDFKIDKILSFDCLEQNILCYVFRQK